VVCQTTEDIDMISFACNSPMSLPYRVKIWFTSVTVSEWAVFYIPANRV